MAGDPIAALVVAGGLFVSTGSLGMAAWTLSHRRRAGDDEEAAPRAPILVRMELGGGALVRMAAPSGLAERGALRLHLLQAGFTAPRALERYLTARSLLALLLPVVGALLVRPETLLSSLALILALASVGYFLPAVVVGRLREGRASEMRRALPDMLDMLVGCLEAGLGLDASLRRVTRELAPVAPQLARQLDLVNAELSAGVARSEALQHLADRAGVDEVGSLVHVMTQSERYGTGVADAIRAHAALVRRHRAIEAERKAAEVSPRLTVVMILFVMPAMFVVLVGPALVQVVERLLPTLTGAR